MSERVVGLERLYVEAVLIGLLIGLTVFALEHWFGAASGQVRLAAILGAGGLLCLVQYGLGKLRR